VVKFVKKINSNKELRPNGYFLLIILLLLVILSGAVLFFSRYNNYDLSALTITPDTFTNGEKTPRVYTVFYKNGTFSPTNIRIRAGDTVRFENHGLFSAHIVSDDLAGFDSIAPIPSGGVFSYTFTVTGIFSYFNKKDIDQDGKVIVR